MGTSRQDIMGWLERAKAQNSHHMLVVCDTFDWEDYPVFVLPDHTVEQETKRILGVGMQKIMEVYSLSLDLDMQLNEYRANHPE